MNWDLHAYNTKLRALDAPEEKELQARGIEERYANVLARLRELDSIETPAPIREIVRSAAEEIEASGKRRSLSTAFHCSADWHLAKLGKYVALVHALALRVQGDDGFFYGSAPQVAEYFGADDKAIRKAFDTLTETGFFEEVEVREGQSTVYRALRHVEWAEKYPGQCAVKRERDADPARSTGRVNDEDLKANPTRSQGSPLPAQRVDTLPDLLPNPTRSEGTKSPKEVSEVVSEEVSESSSGSKNASHFGSLASSLLSSEKNQVLNTTPSLAEPKSSTGATPQAPRQSGVKDKGQQLPKWVHKIWFHKHGIKCPLQIRKKDAYQLTKLIEQHGKKTMAYAWYLYVNADPRPYNLEAVEGVEKVTTKSGASWLQQYEDESEITRMPFAAFLKLPQGYIAATEEVREESAEAKHVTHILSKAA